MIKINVAEIKKRLVGKKDFSYELKPAELNITEADLPLTGTVTVKGTISNAGDVLLWKLWLKPWSTGPADAALKPLQVRVRLKYWKNSIRQVLRISKMMLLFMNLISSI